MASEVTVGKLGENLGDITEENEPRANQTPRLVFSDDNLFSFHSNFDKVANDGRPGQGHPGAGSASGAGAGAAPRQDNADKPRFAESTNFGAGEDQASATVLEDSRYSTFYDNDSELDARGFSQTRRDPRQRTQSIEQFLAQSPSHTLGRKRFTGGPSSGSNEDSEGSTPSRTPSRRLSISRNFSSLEFATTDDILDAPAEAIAESVNVSLKGLRKDLLALDLNMDNISQSFLEGQGTAGDRSQQQQQQGSSSSAASAFAFDDAPASSNGSTSYKFRHRDDPRGPSQSRLPQTSSRTPLYNTRRKDAPPAHGKDSPPTRPHVLDPHRHGLRAPQQQQQQQNYPYHTMPGQMPQMSDAYALQQQQYGQYAHANMVQMPYFNPMSPPPPPPGVPPSPGLSGSADGLPGVQQVMVMPMVGPGMQWAMHGQQGMLAQQMMMQGQHAGQHMAAQMPSMYGEDVPVYEQPRNTNTHGGGRRQHKGQQSMKGGKGGMKQNGKAMRGGGKMGKMNSHHGHGKRGDDKKAEDMHMGGSQAGSAISPAEPLSSFKGRIFQLSQEQNGCRYLQQKVEMDDEESCTLILMEVRPRLVQLMMDPFGNYLFQKLLEHVTPQQRMEMLKQVKTHLVQAALNLHGTRSVQKFIEICGGRNGKREPDMAQLRELVESLSNYVTKLSMDTNGNHVVQRCLQHMPSEISQFVYDAALRDVLVITRHRHGCCVFQRCIDAANPEQRRALVHKVTEFAIQLMQDPFGNYVVQYVLDNAHQNETNALIIQLSGKLATLSMQKFSSNVVEKCLLTAPAQVRGPMIRELADPSTMRNLLHDQFANYVVQRALLVADDEQGMLLVNAIRPHITDLGQFNPSCARRVTSRVVKRFPSLTSDPLFVPFCPTEGM